jgi:hypothetical protein
MKKIYKALFLFIAVGAMFMSCDKSKLEPNFDSMTKAPDPNASYYIQFINAEQSFETGVGLDGSLVDVQTTIGVVLMGTPQSQDITVNLAIDPSSTITSDMYTLSSTSITIPAGKTSGSVDLSTIADKMPVGETLSLVVNIDAGENNSPNTNGTVLKYSLKRIEFCPLLNGAADLVGSWSGTDGQGGYNYSSIITSIQNGTNIDASGMGVGFINDFWGEDVVAGGTCTITIQGNGIIDIPRQYLFTTVYEGANYTYEIEGSGKWDNCGPAPHMLINYDIYYTGDAKGLAATYSSYLGGISYLTADVTLSGKKSGQPVIQFKHLHVIDRK